MLKAGEPVSRELWSVIAMSFECEYYKDGYRAGADDGKMSMSMAYERHDGYDSRFEPYFARGYEAGWMANR